jgi:hypothetical protein
MENNKIYESIFTALAAHCKRQIPEPANGSSQLKLSHILITYLPKIGFLCLPNSSATRGSFANTQNKIKLRGL